MVEIKRTLMMLREVPSLWAFGLLAGLSVEWLTRFIQTGLDPFLSLDPSNPTAAAEAAIFEIERLLNRPEALILTLIRFVGRLGLVWGALIIAEIGMIDRVYQTLHQRAGSFRDSVTAVRRWTLPFLVIDTLILSPLFLLALVLLLIPSSVLIWAASNQPQNLLPAMIGTAVCLIGVGLLFPLLGILTYTLRIVTLRQVIRQPQPARQAVRAGRLWIQTHIGLVLFGLLLTFLISILASLLNRLTGSIPHVGWLPFVSGTIRHTVVAVFWSVLLFATPLETPL